MSNTHKSPSLDPTPGAKWWRVDFHTHTPFSTDAYNGVGEVTERDWLLAHMKEGIDAVVVSDHNGGGWVDSLKQECIQLAQENPDFRPLAIFPGVEITTSQNVHILVILDPSAPGSYISRVLQIARYRGIEGNHETAADCGTVPLVEDLQAQGIGCIVIPAHVNGAKGILHESVPFDTRHKTLSHAMVFTLECHHPKKPDWDLRNLALGDKGFSVVYGSDSHDMSEVGRRTTWVRMESPTLDGLRVALLDGETSVREFVVDQPNPGPHSPYFIEKIRIVGTKYIGRKEDQVIELNPSFNAIIGGRGTGKSSILELVRAATKRGASFNNNTADYAKNFQDLIREITLGLPKEEDDLTPMVEVDYRQHGKTFRMQWHATPPTFSLFTVEEDGTKNLVTDQGIWSERFPLRIFSQKQLYAFKEHTAPLLAEIDATPQVDGPTWQREWENKVAEFVQLSARIQQLTGELKERDDLRAKITDIQRQIEIMEKAGHKKVLRELALRRRQGSEVERWQEQVEPLPAALEDLAARFEVTALTLSRMPADEDAVSSPEDTPEQELEANVRKVKATLDSDSMTLRKMAGMLRDVFSDWQRKIASSDWDVVRKASEEAYLDLIQTIQGQTQTKPEQYGELVQNCQILKKKLDGLDAKTEELERLRKTRKDELVALESRRSQLSACRRGFLDGLFSNDANLRASLIPCGDIPAGIAELRLILSRDENVAVEEFENITSYLVSAIDDQDRLTRIHELKVKLWQVANEGQNGGKDIGIRIGKRFGDHMKGRTTEDRTRLLAWFPADLLKLRYRRDGSGPFKDLEKGSPGQVAAAVLAFLLAYGEEPILLDQPEDDLDNRLIYDLIVREIQTNKLRRQLLIITHNPNIVVNGNADLVIPVEDRNGRAAIPVMGALQNQDVCKVVCDVMEGGREALERRFRRIVT
jgi:ABC-type lipoprotein export system ATPase subunit